MKLVRVINGYEHLWAVKEPNKEYDELTSLFEKCGPGRFPAFRGCTR